VTTEVRAAGGVVWRPGPDGVEICLVHRPRYDDWSLPKGKLEKGEHPLTAAVREVAEETGVRAVPQIRLPGVRYALRDGTPKVVDYWSMRFAGEEGSARTHEADAVRWLAPARAESALTYAHDVRVVRDFAALPAVTAVGVVVRHARAGQRGTWPGPDTARPLEEAGWAEAEAAVPVLEVLRPARLVSAGPKRCVQTLEPLARRLDLPIEVDSRLDEPEPGQNPDENALYAAAALAELAAAGAAFVASSQGKVIPGALRRLASPAVSAGALPAIPGHDGDYTTPKGDGWLLAFAGERLAGADRLALRPPGEGSGD
jgi:8-oxo-dGTP pyrophosphatase MutT (NUDIX family)